MNKIFFTITSICLFSLPSFAQTQDIKVVFTGSMNITPGVSNAIASPIHSVGMIIVQSNGKKVIFADGSGKAISLREMFLKGETEEQNFFFEKILKDNDLHPNDQMEFSGFVGTVVEETNGREIKINQIKSKTRGIEALNVQIDGYAKLDQTNKKTISLNLHIFIALEDLEKFVPGIIDLIIEGNEDIQLQEIENGTRVLSIAKINFNGIALTN